MRGFSRFSRLGGIRVNNVNIITLTPFFDVFGFLVNLQTFQQCQTNSGIAFVAYADENMRTL
jgi:hypothetical protein